jgi:ribulose-5-phosphate 4-epimerase/fuculose-1-phosphate aldolase
MTTPPTSPETRSRDALVRHGKSLYDRGYAHGSSGNLSVRTDDGFLITPTGSSLGRLDAALISKLGHDGKLISGDPPSKEAFLHLAVYAERPSAHSIVHLHCTCAVAVSCLVHEDPRNVLAPLTAYHVMRVGAVPLIPYYRPGDSALAEAVRLLASRHRALLLANHGPVVTGTSIDAAVDSAEELEQTARLTLLLAGCSVSALTASQVAEIEAVFMS